MPRRKQARAAPDEGRREEEQSSVFPPPADDNVTWTSCRGGAHGGKTASRISTCEPGNGAFRREFCQPNRDLVLATLQPSLREVLDRRGRLGAMAKLCPGQSQPRAKGLEGAKFAILGRKQGQKWSQKRVSIWNAGDNRTTAHMDHHHRKKEEQTAAWTEQNSAGDGPG